MCIRRTLMSALAGLKVLELGTLIATFRAMRYIQVEKRRPGS